MPEIGYEYPTGKIKNQQGFPLADFSLYIISRPLYNKIYETHHFSSLFITCSKAFSA